jgi:hypothetical protein
MNRYLGIKTEGTAESGFSAPVEPETKASARIADPTRYPRMGVAEAAAGAVI